MKPDLRIVFRDGHYCITEVHYNRNGKPVRALDNECGILAYWSTVKKLKKSFRMAKKAFDKPILTGL